MPSTFNAVCCALAALAFWTAVGLPITRRLLSSSLAWPLAPLAGWAIHSVVALPIFFLVPFSAITVAIVALLTFPTVWVLLRLDRRPDRRSDRAADDQPRISRWAWAAAFALAVLCAVAILPKQVGDAVILSDQIFDHSKISMVADMARLGLPAGNPFFAHDGGSGRLSYYYLLHFSSAELSRLFGVTGWEADIAMTFFAAFTSLAAMMAIAVEFSGRTSASVWVVAIAATSTSRVLLERLFGGDTLEGWLPQPGGWGGWMFQSSWVPQHLISTSCVVLAVLLMEGFARRRGVLPVVVLASVIAAAFESSTWVGGIVFALVASIVVPLLFVRTERPARVRFVAALAVAGALALALVWPLLADQLAASALRHQGFPITVRAFEALGTAVPEAWRTLLNGPAYWLVFLPIALPAAYVPAMIVLVRSVSRRGSPASRSVAVHALGATALVSLAISWLLVSTIADNNDLGWRAGLLGSVVLIPFAAIGVATWTAECRWFAAGLAVVAIGLGVPEAWMQVGRNVDGHFQAEGRIFATMPELWRRVREHSGADERVASNPLALKSMTPWPVNISWSLLSDRRSCYAGWELTQVFTAVPHDRLRAIDTQFNRVFAGEAAAGDLAELAGPYDCSVAVVTAQDGAWTNDPFGKSPLFTLVDEDAARWRIYRRRDALPTR